MFVKERATANFEGRGEAFTWEFTSIMAIDQLVNTQKFCEDLSDEWATIVSKGRDVWNGLLTTRNSVVLAEENSKSS